MDKRLSKRQWMVIVLGGALYALLFSLGSQIDARGYTALGESLLRFMCAWPVAVCALAVLFSAVFPRLICTENSRGGALVLCAGRVCADLRLLCAGVSDHVSRLVLL